MFIGLAPSRLPVSVGSTVAESNPRQSANFSSTGEFSVEAETDDQRDDAGLVAAPPINQETAVRLEILLSSLESLAEKAENYSDFASTFADLTLRVGILHKALGNNDRASGFLGSGNCPLPVRGG